MRVVVVLSALVAVVVALGCSGGGGGSACDPCAPAGTVDFHGAAGASCGGSAGFDNGGSGLATGAALSPEADPFFASRLDGDFRARTENVFDRPLQDVLVEPGSVGAGQDAGVFYNDGEGTRLRYFDVRDLGVDIRGLGTEQVHLIPSNFTPPEVAPGDVWAYIRIPEGTPGIEQSSLPTVRTAPFPDEWLEDIAQRQAKERKQKRVTSWKRSQIVPNTSKLSVGDNDDLPLEGMKATAQIDGFRARVVLDLIFKNDRQQQLNGTFKLRLPNGASMHYLSFGEYVYEAPRFRPARGTSIPEIREERKESMPKPKEARIVPKEKAAHAFAETVRQQVDPALLEWSGPGVFTASVYPLEPGKLHQVVVGYDVNLESLGDDLRYRLDVPSGIPSLDVDIAVRGVSGTVTPATKAEDGRYRWTNPDARSFEVRIPAPGPVLLTGDDVAGPHFAARFKPELPSAPGATTQRGVFLVDTSLSGNPERFEVWLKLLKALLDANREQMREFAVGFFGIDTHWWRDGFVENTEANAGAVLAYANELALEGATDLGQALAAASTQAGDFDVFLLSDGSATWGDADLYAVSHAAGDHAVFSYATGFTGADQRMLAHLARETGGAVFTVMGEAQLPEVAVAHTKRPWDIVDVEVAGGSDLLLAGRPLALFPGQELLLTGRGLVSRDTAIELTLAHGEAVRRVSIAPRAHVDSPLVSGIYGQVAVRQLESLGAATEDVAKAYATHFRVVGQTCSLLMLETEEDYARFDIKPEDDLTVIRERPASTEVRTTLDAIEATLGDPKARLVASLDKLARAPGVTFEQTQVLRDAIAAMPSEAFRVVAPPLEIEGRRWNDVPGDIQEQLVSRELAYDDISAEAERRRTKYGPGDGLRVLSSLVENNPGDMALARDVGFSALRWGMDAHAYHLFRRVAEMRPYEPQTYYAMARALAKLDQTDLALVYYEIALAGTWDTRFGAFQRIVAVDYQRFLRGSQARAKDFATSALVETRLPEVAQIAGLETSDIVVVIAWNTDRTDVDLHVIDPNKEECYYSHPDTKIGGHLTADVTQGYGPEMFTLPKAIRGTYYVRAKYFSSDAARTATRTKVFVTIYEDYGKPTENVMRRSLTLRTGKEVHEIARLKR